MSEKKMTKQEYLQIKSKLEARKAELLELKKAGGKSWTESLQEELDNIAMSIADVEDKIDAIPATTKMNRLCINQLKAQRNGALVNCAWQTFQSNDWKRNLKALHTAVYL